MKSKYVSLTVFCVLLSLLVSTLAWPALADHFVFSGQDPDFHQANSIGNRGPKTFANHKWALTPGSASSNSVSYYIDTSTIPSTPPPRASATPSVSHVNTAIANWESTVDGLNWIEASSSGSAEMLIEFKFCGPAVGSFNPNRRWYTDSIREARYWETAGICINSYNGWINEGAIISAIAHELGHAYGLHEAYIDRGKNEGRCNPDRRSIMDNLHNAHSGHCDNLQGPSTTDRHFVDKFYKTGTLSNFTAEVDEDGNTVDFSWKDNAWGEVHHNIMVMHTFGDVDESDIAASIWQTFDGSEYAEGTGRHKDMIGVPDKITGSATLISPLMLSNVSGCRQRHTTGSVDAHSSIGRAPLGRRNARLRSRSAMLYTTAPPRRRREA